MPLVMTCALASISHSQYYVQRSSRIQSWLGSCMHEECFSVGTILLRLLRNHRFRFRARAAMLNWIENRLHALLLQANT